MSVDNNEIINQIMIMIIMMMIIMMIIIMMIMMMLMIITIIIIIKTLRILHNARVLFYLTPRKKRKYYRCIFLTNMHQYYNNQ